MVLLLAKTIRNCSFLTTPISRFLSATLTVFRKRSRLVPLLVLLILGGVVGGVYVYASFRWQAAERAVKEGKLLEAQRDLDLCLLVWPRSVPVHLLAARTARLRGDLKEAESQLSRCLKLNHGASEAIQLEFFLLRVQGGEVDKVVDELFLYVNTGSPESSVILDTLARAYMQNRRYGQAFACLSRWTEVDPDSAEPHLWRGWILERMNDREGALNEYKTALEKDPHYFLVRLRLAELHMERRDPSAALPILEQLHKEFPDRLDVQARLGQCLFARGEKLEEARRLLEIAVKELPNDISALISLARLDITETPPRFEEAEGLLRRAKELDPTDTETQHMLIRCLEAQGRSKEAHELQKERSQNEAALKRVNETLKQDADRPVTDPAALTEVGLVFLRANNELVAVYWLNRALQSDPDYQPALRAIVEYYEKSGRATKAATYRQRLKPEKTVASPKK